MSEKREYKKLKTSIAIKVALRTVWVLILGVLVFHILIDDVLNDYLANSVADYSRSLYNFLVANKTPILLLTYLFFTFFAIFLAVRFVTRYMVSIIEAMDKIIKKPEEEIQLQSDLILIENRLNQMRIELINKEREAREAETKKNDLIVYMAHDLKTPLTSVIGYLTLLSDEPNISKDLQERYLKIALDKANRLEELTNEFFDITRFNLQSMPITRKQINLSYLLDQLVDECYPMLSSRNLQCELTKPNQIPFWGDGDKLARALDNLLKNAINYSYEGTTIQIEAKEEEQNILLRFHNKGDAIPSYKLEKIFEKFYRLDEARTSKTGGAGLGLAITKQIIELHGGKIEAESEGNDIVFTVILPK